MIVRYSVPLSPCIVARKDTHRSKEISFSFQLFHLLSRLGISLPERSKIPMLSDIGQINGKGVCAALTNGRTIKVTVDNIDGRIKANQVLPHGI
jgi:hypothetical protein